uniref:Uncharacterized protein n=1 Tax=Staphylococcus warneri TaxID=1292 RepID=Q75V36_STAWA|nr:hypothetical protein [Staphylococcus warneri]
MAQLNTVPTAVVKTSKLSVIMKTHHINHHRTTKTHHKRQQHSILNKHNMIQQIKRYQRQVNLILV